MQIRITRRTQRISSQIKDYIETKVKKLRKYSDRILDSEVVIGTEKNLTVVEIRAKVERTNLRVVTKDKDITKAIDFAVDKLEVQLKKFKGKQQQKEHVRISEILSEEEG